MELHGVSPFWNIRSAPKQERAFGVGCRRHRGAKSRVLGMKAPADGTWAARYEEGGPRHVPAAALRSGYTFCPGGQGSLSAAESSSTGGRARSSCLSIATNAFSRSLR